MIRDDYDASCQKAVMHSTGNNLIQRRKQPARLHMSTSMSQEYVELMIYLFESLMWRNSSRDRLKGNELFVRCGSWDLLRSALGDLALFSVSNEEIKPVRRLIVEFPFEICRIGITWSRKTKIRKENEAKQL